MPVAALEPDSVPAATGHRLDVSDKHVLIESSVRGQCPLRVKACPLCTKPVKMAILAYAAISLTIIVAFGYYWAPPADGGQAVNCTTSNCTVTHVAS